MEEILKATLSERQLRRINDNHRTPSAVIVPLYHHGGHYYLVLTKRTDRVQMHKGQVCFPGGAHEEKDHSLENTAIRECAEEIGLSSEAIHILGRLDDVATNTSKYVISPFVALIRKPATFKLDQREVEQVIEVPVDALREKGCLHRENEIVGGELITTYAYHYGGQVIWGATARILNQFLEIFSSLNDKQPAKSK